MKFYKFLCQFVKLNSRKTALDKPLYKLSAGRSMVEMLGVLAIIGVLSVGALSGYSKAMNKYKLNKHAYQISQLINTIHLYQYQLRYTNKNQFSLIPILQKLNIIPEGMTIENGDKEYLKDSMGSYNAVYINAQPYNNETILVIYGQPKYATPISFQDISVGIQHCRNILENLQIVFKENQQNLCYIYMTEKLGGSNLINLTQSSYNFANMSTSEINNLCAQQIQKNKQILYHICFKNTI